MVQQTELQTPNSPLRTLSQRVQIRAYVLGSQAVGTGAELGVAPTDEEIPNEPFFAGQVIEEQRFPDLPVAPRFGHQVAGKAGYLGQ